MTAPHTTGPWCVYHAPQYSPHDSEDDNHFVVGPSEFHTVAHVRPGNSDDGLPEQTVSNARLIAAAPALLAALEAQEEVADWTKRLGKAEPYLTEWGAIISRIHQLQEHADTLRAAALSAAKPQPKQP